MLNFKKLKKFYSNFLDIIYPPLCFNCKEKLTENSILCEKCKNLLLLVDDEQCFVCEKKLAVDGICSDCKKKFLFDGFVTAFRFNEIIQTLIHNFKYNEYKKIGDYLSSFLVKKILEHNFVPFIDYIIPVPLHKVKKRARGFNQSLIIAQSIHNILQIPLADSVIRRKRFTKTQTNLTRTERQRNVAQAFEINKDEFVTDKNLLLIDDVFTTGSTLASMTNELKSGGAKNIYCATLARA